jgi:hypothetical protein
VPERTRAWVYRRASCKRLIGWRLRRLCWKGAEFSFEPLLLFTNPAVSGGNPLG